MQRNFVETDTSQTTGISFKRSIMKKIIGIASIFAVSVLIVVLAISPTHHFKAQNFSKIPVVSQSTPLHFGRQPHLALAGFDDTVTTECVSSDPNHQSLYYTWTCCPPDGSKCTVFNRRHAVEEQCPGGGYTCGTFDPPITGSLYSTWIFAYDNNGEILYTLQTVDCLGDGPC
jgi:hypothetical protein